MSSPGEYYVDNKIKRVAQLVIGIFASPSEVNDPRLGREVQSINEIVDLAMLIDDTIEKKVQQEMNDRFNSSANS